MRSPILDKLRAAPLALVAFALTACTGTSTGQPDPDAAGRTAEQAQQFAIDNGRLIGAAIIAACGVAFLAFLWRSPAMRIVGAMIIAGGFVYFAMGGGR